MKIKIVYASYHHNNTERVVMKLQEKLRSIGHELNLYDVTKNPGLATVDSDLTIFASGIYYFDFHKNLYKLLENGKGQAGGSAFIFYTAGVLTDKFFNKIIDSLKSKGYNIIETYGILGFDTYGPYKLVGGLNKNRPNNEDIEGLFDTLIKTMEINR